MNYTFVNSPGVRADVSNAVEFYKEISPKLAKQFLHRIREAKVHIERTPLGFQVKYKNVRTLMLKQFPFQIHYLVDKEAKQIVILAIIHAHKNPADYSSR